MDARRTGYYEWLRRREERPQRVRMDEVLTAKIENAFYESKRIYGARKIQALLRRENYNVGRRRARRLMVSAGLVPVTYKRHVATTDSRFSMLKYGNLLLLKKKELIELGKIWVSGMTYIRTDEGWLYLCTVMDLCSRRIIGWETSDKIDRYLAMNALNNAVATKKPKHGAVFHSDRGCQYASSDFGSLVWRLGMRQSMSAPGKPGENAYAESFFRSVKVECTDLYSFATRDHARSVIAEYILNYNRVRIHASLGNHSPIEFESTLLDAGMIA